MDAASARERQRREWALSAPGWLAYRGNLAAPSGAMTSRILARAGARPGESVLDLACGIGNPSDVLAGAVGPAGTVLGLDISAEMIEGARKWAEHKGISNAEFRVVPSERDLRLEPGVFDLAVCRVGLQYMPEPAAALQAVYEALRPGGRMVATTLGNPGLCMAFRISSGVIGKYAPPPAPSAAEPGPGPVAVSEPSRLRELFSGAGFTEVSVERFETTLIEIDCAEACWEMFEQTMGPLIAMRGALPEDQARALRADGVAALRAEFGDGPVALTGEVLLAAGVKPV